MYRCCRTEATYICRKSDFQKGRKELFFHRFQGPRGHETHSAHNWFCELQLKYEREKQIAGGFSSMIAAEFSFQLLTCCGGPEHEHTHTNQTSSSSRQKTQQSCSVWLFLKVKEKRKCFGWEIKLTCLNVDLTFICLRWGISKHSVSQASWTFKRSCDWAFTVYRRPCMDQSPLARWHILRTELVLSRDVEGAEVVKTVKLGSCGEVKGLVYSLRTVCRIVQSFRNYPAPPFWCRISVRRLRTFLQLSQTDNPALTPTSRCEKRLGVWSSLSSSIFLTFQSALMRTTINDFESPSLSVGSSALTGIQIGALVFSWL